jgi:type IV fimbrial biogenesis protein FimT
VKQPAVITGAARRRRIASLAQACLRNLAAMGIAAKSNPGGQCSAGFTMIELVTVIAIVGILMAIGVPSFRYVTTANRISAEVNGLLGDMQFARAEAIKEGWPVVVCASANSTSANPTCSNTNTWQSGWIICSDKNNSGTCDAGDPVFRIQKSFAATSSTDTFVASPNTSTLIFNREGFATGLAGTVTVKLHSAPAVVNAYTRCLQITAVGTLNVELVNQGNCT